MASMAMGRRVRMVLRLGEWWIFMVLDMDFMSGGLL